MEKGSEVRRRTWPITMELATLTLNSARHRQLMNKHRQEGNDLPRRKAFAVYLFPFLRMLEGFGGVSSTSLECDLNICQPRRSSRPDTSFTSSTCSDVLGCSLHNVTYARSTKSINLLTGNARKRQDEIAESLADHSRRAWR